MQSVCSWQLAPKLYLSLRATPRACRGGSTRKTEWASAVLGQEYYYQPVSPDPIPTPVPAAFGDTFTDILNVSNNDGPIETTAASNFAPTRARASLRASANESCSMDHRDKHARLQNPNVPMWSYRRSCGNVDCAARNFDNEDPFPGQLKQCRCSLLYPHQLPNPRQMDGLLANEGRTCQCGNNSVIRYGSSGSRDMYAGGSNPTFLLIIPR